MWQYAAIKAAACRRQDGTEMESDSCQEGSGLLRSPHRGLPLFTACWLLPVYRPETRPATENIAGQTWHIISMKEQMEQIKDGHSLLCCGRHWYNDCVEICVHVGGSE